ncbi:uncharacterized protein LOC131212619 [Anopheles bellator]|uniref:uncharacterized protein LOC131212619 n=1 Tax=Anopheles bellator TaxID=139047 RepID=UPI002648D09D|nr:uncharacterized protein LOC131212619 [Anopheles bellator]
MAGNRTDRIRLALIGIVLGALSPNTEALCRIREPLTAGCSYAPLLLVEEWSGWVLSRENCDQTVAVATFTSPPVVYFDRAAEDRLYTLLFLEPEGATTGRYALLWLVTNVPGSVLTTGMTYMDGETVIDYHSPVPDDDVQPTRYGFYLYEQVYGTIYPPTPTSREDFDLDDWIGSLYPEGSLCSPIASIGFSLM